MLLISELVDYLTNELVNERTGKLVKSSLPVKVLVKFSELVNYNEPVNQ